MITPVHRVRSGKLKAWFSVIHWVVHAAKTHDGWSCLQTTFHSSLKVLKQVQPDPNHPHSIVTAAPLDHFCNLLGLLLSHLPFSVKSTITYSAYCITCWKNFICVWVCDSYRDQSFASILTNFFSHSFFGAKILVVSINGQIALMV